MRNLIKEEIIQSRDVMFLPEYEIGLWKESTILYELRFDKAKYQLDKIHEAASLAGFRGKNVAAKQVKLLGSSVKNPESTGNVSRIHQFGVNN